MLGYTFPVNDMNLMVPGAGAFKQDIGTGGVSSVNAWNAFLDRFFQQRYIGTFDVPNVTSILACLMEHSTSIKTMRRHGYIGYWNLSIMNKASTTFRLTSLTACKGALLCWVYGPKAHGRNAGLSQDVPENQL